MAVLKIENIKIFCAVSAVNLLVIESARLRDGLLVCNRVTVATLAGAWCDDLAQERVNISSPHDQGVFL